MGPKKKRRIQIIVGLLVIILGGAAALFFLSTDEQKEEFRIRAEMEIAKKKVEVYKSYLAAIREIKKGHKVEAPKYEGYDAFDYNKETEYEASLDEQQRRLGDLQSRLSKAYDR